MTRERLVSPFGVGEVVVETEPARLRPRSVACPGATRPASPGDRARHREPLRFSPKHFLLDLFTYPNFCGIAPNAGLEKSRPLPETRPSIEGGEKTDAGQRRAAREGETGHVRGRQERRRRPKARHPTPLLDELESGPWPSFVTGLKRLRDAADKPYAPMMNDLLGQLEHSYEERLGFWKGGTVSVFGYGGGVIPRFSEVGDQISGVEGIPYAARPAAGGLSLHDRPAAPAL